MTDEFTQFSQNAKFANESELLAELTALADLSNVKRVHISQKAATLVERLRDEERPTLMEQFLSEYGLSTKEGVALMCLAEAMLRVPDADTMDALIEDKIVPSNWGRHLGQASSSLVNASTWALMLTGRVLEDEKPGIGGLLHGAIKRLGEPVIRAAVSQVMKEMGRQFVLGETIEAALKRGAEAEAEGYTHSYDMLGEAAMTAEDAARYKEAYVEAIAAIARKSQSADVAQNPGISIKLSALHPRYEVAQKERVLTELTPVLIELAQMAKAANIGLNVDAEEQDRLVLSLQVINGAISDPSLAGWDGFGVVVQAYGKRCAKVIRWLAERAKTLDRRFMVRLVKGAYWDTEIKHAQVEAYPDFPVFTTKAATDVSYIANAKLIFDHSERLYPQFATHNAHSVVAIQEMAGGRPFEFQRLHGMGERLHDIVLKEGGGRCRIYAPVGAHRDLLAYLVRRLLENGANSSFVHQIVDEEVDPSIVAADPFETLGSAQAPAGLKHPADLFAPSRKNSRGFDLSDEEAVVDFEAERKTPLADVSSLTVKPAKGKLRKVKNPTTFQTIRTVEEMDETAVSETVACADIWSASPSKRAKVLRRAADLYEENHGAFFATLAQEAGKTWVDAVGELREAVDFLRFYADEAERIMPNPRGRVVAISPWNFPLAIFTGQIAAALAAGNAVIAKPAEQTPLVAHMATLLLHQAGVPISALQLLLGRGETVGAALTREASVDAVVFTGSTQTAKLIAASMAENMAPGTPLIAETGGLNAMIVDSTALPEQAVRDIIASSFQSAGQRCSALRCLYVQEDIADGLEAMIIGAMNELNIGDPWLHNIDVGPVIDEEAYKNIDAYISAAKSKGSVRHQIEVPKSGFFIPPSLIRVDGIDEMKEEVFGPVLHIARYAAEDLPKVIAEINATGYGLTFGLHSRIDDRVQDIADQVDAGNIYINRNQIGAIVASQPFGGMGLSGTGPKAGGPNYVARFSAPMEVMKAEPWDFDADIPKVMAQLEQVEIPEIYQVIQCPGPTGEANTLSLHPRAPVLCLGPGKDALSKQLDAVEKVGGVAVAVEGNLAPEELGNLIGYSAVLYWGENAQSYAKILASRSGPIIPLITTAPDIAHVLYERHICVDTTAAGGNAALLAS